MRDDGDQVTVDLHGQPTGYAIHELAPAVIETAWRRGYKSVTLIHGSPDITSYRQSVLSRGSIKWGLRGQLNRGELDRWVWNRRSAKHSGLEVDSGAMTLALRPNPNPDPEYPWPDVDEPTYDY